MSFKVNDDGTVSVMCDVCGGMLKESDGTLETYKAQRDAVFPDREAATDALWDAGWEDNEIRPSWERSDDPVIVTHECDDCKQDDLNHQFGY